MGQKIVGGRQEVDLCIMSLSGAEVICPVALVCISMDNTGDKGTSPVCEPQLCIQL